MWSVWRKNEGERISTVVGLLAGSCKVTSRTNIVKYEARESNSRFFVRSKLKCSSLSVTSANSVFPDQLLDLLVSGW